MSFLDFQVIGAKETGVGLRNAGKQLVTNLQRMLTKLGLKLLRHVVQDKLHGQVLHQRSGRLAGSVHRTEHFSDTKNTEIVGTNVVYAAIHEYGGVIQHPGGTAYYYDPKIGMARWVPNSDARASFLPRTKPHAIRMPERSYLRSALADLQVEIIADLKSVAAGGAA